MTLKASREALVGCAAGWDGIATELEVAREEIRKGDGKGSEFGWFASRAGIDTAHNTFIDSMIDALTQGAKHTREVGDALQATAKDFGATDLSVADEFHNPDGTPR
jgi:hypothetical protein